MRANFSKSDQFSTRFISETKSVTPILFSFLKQGCPRSRSLKRIYRVHLGVILTLMTLPLKTIPVLHTKSTDESVDQNYLTVQNVFASTCRQQVQVKRLQEMESSTYRILLSMICNYVLYCSSSGVSQTWYNWIRSVTLCHTLSVSAELQ